MSGSSDGPTLINGTTAASITIWPHGIHRNYQGMKNLPVSDVKDPF